MQMCREVDNVGKVFFSVSNQRVTKVFRFSCVLGEPVDGPALSRALQMTVKEFPFFQVEANRGMFWYSQKKAILLRLRCRNLHRPVTKFSRRT